MPVDLEVQCDFYRGMYCRMKTQEHWANGLKEEQETFIVIVTNLSHAY